MIRAQGVQHELPEAEHRHELVVDLVGYAARQRPHRLEPLHLAELFLRVKPVGDVGVGADPFADPAVVVEHRHRADVHAAVFAVPAPETVLGGERPAAGDRLAPGADRLLPVVGVDRLEPASPRRLGAALAGEGLPLAGVDGPPAVGGRGPHDLGGGRDQGPVPRFAAAERFLGVLLHGEVVVHLDHGSRAAIRIPVENPVTRHLHPEAAAGPSGQLAVPFAVREQRGRDFLRRRRQLGVQQPHHVGADRITLLPPVEAMGTGAPELNPAVQASRQHRGVIEDLQQLARLLHALSERRARRLLRLEQPLAQCPLRHRPLGGPPLAIRATHHGRHPKRRHQREAHERRDEQRQRDVLLVEAEPEREQASRREEHRDHHRHRQQAAQQDRSWVPPGDEL